MKKLIPMIMLFVFININAMIYDIEFSSASMGSGSVNSVDMSDNQSILTNPSLLSISGWNFVKLSYNDFYSDIKFYDIQFGFYLEEMGNIALTLLIGDYGSQIERNEFGDELGEFNNHDIGLVLTLSDYISDNVTAGINLKYLNSKIHESSNNALFLDLGFSFILDDLFIGMYIKNWGTSIEYVRFGHLVPITTGVGASYGFDMGNSMIRPMMEFNYCDNYLRTNLGVFYKISSFIFRTGIYDLFNNFSRRYNLGINIAMEPIIIEFSLSYNPNLKAIISAGINYLW